MSFFFNFSDRISWFYMLYLNVYRNMLGIKRDPSIQRMRVLNKVVRSILGNNVKLFQKFW